MRRLALGLGVVAACAGPASAPRAPTSPVLARVDGAPITEDVVRATAQREGLSARDALRLLVDEALLAGEARRRGLGDAWLEDDARWHARVRKLLEDEVEARNRGEMLPREQVDDYIRGRRAAVCHDGLRRVVHAVFLAQGDARPDGRRLRMEAAVALRQRLVKDSGARPSEADLRRIAGSVAPRPPNIEALPPLDRFGGMVSGGGLVEPFARAVWSLEPIVPLSEAFETSFGAHVALLLEEIPPSGVSCESVRPALTAELERRLRSAASQALVQRLRAAAVIRVDTVALRGSERRALSGVRRGALDRSGFTNALEALLHDLPEVLCATFIDDEGETIDLATRIDPFEARVAGAAFSLPLTTARATLRRARLGGLGELRVEGGRRSVLVRQVAIGCDLVLVIDGPGISAAASMRGAVAARELCAEAGLEPPPHHHALRAVELRRRPDGLAAPRAFVEGDVRRRVAAVLGVARHGAQIVWLVRVAPDEEVLLAHDLTTDRWDRFDAAVDREVPRSASFPP